MRNIIKLTGNRHDGYSVKGAAINSDSETFQVSYYSTSLEKARKELDYYTDNNGFECQRIIELSELPPAPPTVNLWFPIDDLEVQQ